MEIKKSLAYCINSILQYEYIHNKIKLCKDSKYNLKIFTDESSKRFEITKEELKSMLDLFEIAEAHKESPIEILRGDKIIILSDRMKQNSISLEKIKEFLVLAKNILKKTKNKMFPNF